MKTYYYLNFPGGKRLYAECQRETRPPIHTYLVFPSNHSEVKGFLSAWVTDTSEYIEKTEVEDHWVVDLTPCFALSIETFLADQQCVGRFVWYRNDAESV
jgi:hypothetical protein